MDMVERAGRAVAKILWPHNSDPYASGGKTEEIARAVIEAMREPTDAMLENAGTMEGFDADAWVSEADRCHREWWNTMIDAALGPQTNQEAERLLSLRQGEDFPPFIDHQADDERDEHGFSVTELSRMRPGPQTNPQQGE